MGCFRKPGDVHWRQIETVHVDGVDFGTTARNTRPEVRVVPGSTGSLRTSAKIALYSGEGDELEVLVEKEQIDVKVNTSYKACRKGDKGWARGCKGGKDILQGKPVKGKSLSLIHI